MATTGAKLARPAWATKIKKLRSSLGMNQTDFGRKFGVTAMSVSRWEDGTNEPPADVYINLGTMADGEDGWYFWNRAGLTKTVLRAAARKK